MEEVIRKILEVIKERAEDWKEVEFASIKNGNPDYEDLEDLAEFFDPYDWMYNPRFETWCSARSELLAYGNCLEMIVDALGKDSDEFFDKTVNKVIEEAKEEALKKVKSGESKWLDDDSDESDWLNND
jgi:hypothetical protein